MPVYRIRIRDSQDNLLGEGPSFPALGEAIQHAQSRIFDFYPHLKHTYFPSTSVSLAAIHVYLPSGDIFITYSVVHANC